ncbi:hypothetical protein [Brevundimonas sp.]|uniref:hypothetical protein n=1 Tax=Brevundimonas sp. TaxID=1871086 RepID=UPI0025F6DF3D|nr:hypothetical protein [Brevundimonas sp.]
MSDLFVLIAIVSGFISVTLRLWAQRSDFEQTPMTPQAREAFDAKSARARRTARVWAIIGGASAFAYVLLEQLGANSP